MKLGEKIKNIRFQLKLTQIALADRLKVSQNTISQYEKETKNPSYEVLKKISDLAKKHKIKIELL